MPPRFWRWSVSPGISRGSRDLGWMRVTIAGLYSRAGNDLRVVTPDHSGPGNSSDRGRRRTCSVAGSAVWIPPEVMCAITEHLSTIRQKKTDPGAAQETLTCGLGREPTPCVTRNATPNWGELRASPTCTSRRNGHAGVRSRTRSRADSGSGTGRIPLPIRSRKADNITDRAQMRAKSVSSRLCGHARTARRSIKCQFASCAKTGMVGQHSLRGRPTSSGILISAFLEKGYDVGDRKVRLVFVESYGKCFSCSAFDNAPAKRENSR